MSYISSLSIPEQKIITGLSRTALTEQAPTFMHGLRPADAGDQLEFLYTFAYRKWMPKKEGPTSLEIRQLTDLICIAKESKFDLAGSLKSSTQEFLILMTFDDVMKRFDIGEKTLNKRVQAGRIPNRLLPDVRPVLFSFDEVYRAWLIQNNIQNFTQEEFNEKRLDFLRRKFNSAEKAAKDAKAEKAAQELGHESAVMQNTVYTLSNVNKDNKLSRKNFT